MSKNRLVHALAVFMVLLTLSGGLLFAADAPKPEPPTVLDRSVGWLEGLMPEGLRKTGFLLQWWQWIGIFLIAALAVILDRIVTAVARGVIDRLLKTEKIREVAGDTDIPDSLRKNAERPFGIMAAGVLVLLLLPLLSLGEEIQDILNLAAVLVLAGSGVWASYRLMDLISVYLMHLASRTETKLDDMLVPLLRRISKVFILAIGIVFVAQNMGIEVGSLLAGLGIGGLAFALAAKDTVANIFGSITVLFDQPFQVGDWVLIEGVEGTVERVGFRSTRIRTFYNSLITLPNSKLITSMVDNYGVRSYRRYKARFGLNFNTPPWKIEAFCEGLRELVRSHPYTRKDYFHIYLNDLGESALEVLIYIFHETPDWATELRERHRFLVDALRLADRLGVDLAFPTRTIQIEGTPETAKGPVPAKKAAKTKGKKKSAEPAGVQDPLDLGRSAAREIARENLPEDGSKPAPVTFEPAE